MSSRRPRRDPTAFAGVPRSQAADIEDRQDARADASFLVAEPAIAKAVEPLTVAPTTTTRRRIYDTDRPRRDPTAFADVDPDYVEQIELRQDVQLLGRAYQTDPSDVAQARLQTKYDEYIDVRKARGAMVPSADIQYRATHPRSAADLRAQGVPVPEPIPIAPPAGAPRPLAPGLNFRADTGIRRLLFLGVVAAIVREIARA